MTPPGRPIYLDYNATAPLLPAAREAMLRALDERPGNPSSPHRFGQAARDALETARSLLAPHLGCSRREWLFTSGGSESNNMALRWLADLPPPVHLVTTPIEHPSVLRCAEWLAARGVAVDYLPVTAEGVVQVEALERLLRPGTRLVSVMAANNETGVLQPLERLGQIVQSARASGRAPGVLLHTDAVQAFGRVPLPLKAWGVDAATVAAHKLGGPKGVGALALREHAALRERAGQAGAAARRPGAAPAEGAAGRADAGIPAWLLGGKQERGRRAGTEAEFLATGFAAAAEWVFARLPEQGARLTALRDRLERQALDIPGCFINGAQGPRVPNTSNLGFDGVAGESLVVALDLDGVAVSTGSACSSGALEPSHVLLAMGLPEARVRASVRISLGWGSTEADVDRCAEVLRAEVRRLRAVGAAKSATA